MGMQEFTASGTFTWPVGITEATVECWGGGGAAGSAVSTGEGGGGGGAYARATVTKTAATATVTVGSGGVTGGGAASSFAQGATTNCRAVGGSAGSGRIGGAGGAAGSCTGDMAFSGGDGGTTSNLPNTGGSGGGASAGRRSDGDDGESASTDVGAGGGAGDPTTAASGSGGVGGDNGEDGGDASQTGGGGGGGGAGGARGAGFRGRVIARWLTQYPRLKFVASQCCPELCDVPRIFMVDDIDRPQRTRYPLVATVTASGFDEGTLGCCADFDGSLVMNLGYVAYAAGGPYAQSWHGSSVTSPIPPRYAVGTLNPTNTLGSPETGHAVCSGTGSIGAAMHLLATGGECLLRVGIGVSVVYDFWYTLPAQTSAEWFSDCHPTGGGLVFVCPDQIIGTLDTGKSAIECNAPATVTIDFSDFVEYPLAGDEIVTVP